MKVMVIVSAVLAAAAAQYLPYAGYGYAGFPYAAGNSLASPLHNTYNAHPLTYTAAAPYTTYNAAPFSYAPYTTYAAPVPASVSSQYHAQDELGSYSYGYADGQSTKHENKNAYGGTVGSYSYRDANGIVQTVSYVADAAGFRVKATKPAGGPEEAAAAAEAAPDARKKRSAVAPLPVSDTPEVVAAKAEHARLYAAAAAAADAAPDTDGPVYTPAVYSGYAPTVYSGYAGVAPVLLRGRACHPSGLWLLYGYSSAHLPFYGRYFY
ncbi:Cuticle protein 6 [Amphibalanus amphitrite]|uniref:Cuticle protein 6 n=1 Tax=Amphibalanus amphitrite TaxID=1232801 RepID=A0A6A4X1Y4_AMPAM|nr:Cuticle protein 6 [Amphibalanus amphitrite]